MSRGTWETLKLSKSFYIRTYRLGIKFLMVSMVINCLLSVLVCYLHIYEPEPSYYATSGIVPPIKLQALNSKNDSSVPLLPPDPVEEEQQKPLP